MQSIGTLPGDLEMHLCFVRSGGVGRRRSGTDKRTRILANNEKRQQGCDDDNPSLIAHMYCRPLLELLAALP